MNKTWEEFQNQSKVKQIFTPWFIVALVVLIVGLSVAIAMAVMLNRGFEDSRAIVDQTNNLSLMKYTGYDPHANYQAMYKAILKGLETNNNFDDLYNKALANDKSLSKELIEALTYHSHTDVINHNSTWGFTVKVLGGGQESWFYLYNQLFAKNASATLVDAHHHLVQKHYIDILSKIDEYQGSTKYGYDYNAFYWVFIVFMMPQMIATVIIVVKLATVLNPKRSKEEKEAYKLAKKVNKSKKGMVILPTTQEEIAGAH